MDKEYKVLKIDEMTRLDEMGRPTQVYRYTARSKGGTVFTVEIDDPDPTSEKVAPILAKKAAELDAILKL